jgi:hypothetical protein
MPLQNAPESAGTHLNAPARPKPLFAGIDNQYLFRAMRTILGK